MTGATYLAVLRALETAGVEFIDGNGGGPGVRLRKIDAMSVCTKSLSLNNSGSPDVFASV